MASEDAERICAELRAEAGSADISIEEARRAWSESAALEPLPNGTVVEEMRFGDVDAEWVTHADSAGVGVFLLLHGGGFTGGGCATHRKLAAYLSKATDTRVLVPEYRLAPENPFPAALQDVSMVYGALLKSGLNPEALCIGGDSAGGGLAATLLLALRDAKGPLPMCAVLLSAWTDLTVSGESYEINKEADPSITREELQEAAAHYVGEADPAHPMLSPIFADLSGLPPVLMQVGTTEVMLDDSRIFAERAEFAGVEVAYEEWGEMWHGWHRWVPNVPEAVEAIDKIGEFVRRHLVS